MAESAQFNDTLARVLVIRLKGERTVIIQGFIEKIWPQCEQKLKMITQDYISRELIDTGRRGYYLLSLFDVDASGLNIPLDLFDKIWEEVKKLVIEKFDVYIKTGSFAIEYKGEKMSKEFFLRFIPE